MRCRRLSFDELSSELSSPWQPELTQNALIVKLTHSCQIRSTFYNTEHSAVHHGPPPHFKGTLHFTTLAVIVLRQNTINAHRSRPSCHQLLAVLANGRSLRTIPGVSRPSGPSGRGHRVVPWSILAPLAPTYVYFLFNRDEKCE